MAKSFNNKTSKINNKGTETEIQRITRQIVKKYKPEKIILFGSWAWGKPTEDSDVDLFIVKNTQKKKINRMYEVYKLLWSKKVPLDILVYSPKEVKERLSLGDFFIDDIIRNGKLIYERK